MTQVLYRFNDQHGVVRLEHYPIAKRTPKGVWILMPGTWPQKSKFVLNDSIKRYAYESKDDAKTSFLARKRRQLLILRAQIKHIEIAVESMQEDRLNDQSHLYGQYFEFA